MIGSKISICAVTPVRMIGLRRDVRRAIQAEKSCANEPNKGGTAARNAI